MIIPGRFIRRISVMLAALLVTSATLAATIDVTYVGTWDSTGSGNPTGSGGPGLSVGQKYVIKISYNDLSTATNNVDVLNAFFVPSGDQMTTINLNDGGNSLDIWVPMEGLDGTSPFVYQQNEGNHFPAFIPNPTLNFTNNSLIGDPNNIIGMEYEGDFVSGAGNNFIELFNTSPGGDNINMVSQVLNFGTGPAANDTNGLSLAVDLVIDAGPSIVYNAASLTQTTSSSVIQSNDLGAARGDNEDFVDAAWTESAVALTGTVEGAAMNDIGVHIANSGLTNTGSTATWDVTMTEQGTGLSDTDSVGVSYANAGPLADAGVDIVFSAANALTGAATTGATVGDADLAVNATIANFEQLTFTSVAGNPLVGGTINGSTVFNNVDQLIAIADSGLTTTTSVSSFDLSVTDFAGATDSDAAVISYLNATPSASATATATATGVDFTLSVVDMDLIVNAIIAGFESVTTTALVGLTDATAFFNTLITTGLQSFTSAALEVEFGLGLHTVDFSSVDLAGATATASAAFEVLDSAPQPVPEPGTLTLLLAGILGLIYTRRRRMQIVAGAC